ncbi:phage tail protein [Pedobacter montanisoli]|uniref:Tail fiber protein n=1 Tax=Pedobacter montanisoli TaxID=2923277 RepID=A0ABS9ZTE1_9SPHI|nr:tail fiber protein [Pedobacter montanisoli]MCJ0741860.1 tail fiber protein [Pedobacter montanisoli]
MEAFIGSIMLWPLENVPRGWHVCDGTSLQIRNYQALYSLIGTTYGGNASTDFNLPDLRGRAPLFANMTVPQFLLATKGGEETHVLTSNEMPQHTHAAGAVTNLSAQLKVSAQNALQPLPAQGATIATSGVNNAGSFTADANYNQATPNVALNDQSVVVQSVTASTSIAGASAPHNNMQPYLVMNYIICLVGLYPPRP